MLDYIRDGQEIYRQSFATIRAEADLSQVPPDLEKLAVRVIHACGMVDVVYDLRFSAGAGTAGRTALAAGAPILVLMRLPRIPFYWLLLLGLSQGAVQMALLLFGMEFGMPAGLAALVLQIQVLFTTMFAFLLLGEKPRLMQYVGIVISLAGMVVIASTMPGGATMDVVDI